jgi:hypothetical protein
LAGMTRILFADSRSATLSAQFSYGIDVAGLFLQGCSFEPTSAIDRRRVGPAGAAPR